MRSSPAASRAGSLAIGHQLLAYVVSLGLSSDGVSTIVKSGQAQAETGAGSRFFGMTLEIRTVGIPADEFAVFKIK
ncbi:hypothetical protein D0839_11075 [Bordetella avium]|nr:hypothetical protein C0J07_13550 [Bordetella avium]RIQ17374.1 hypothetical protein D0850_10920 [Bordetella avium]RIQ33861.1 hypothetical protein D0849_09685 [Bordetella avium]RIQ52049.1 hypothetical protein D0843_09255 [Bordetella avium]RIQ68238.1 hypothetical protein D0838_15325 [Bordetella avium]